MVESINIVLFWTIFFLILLTTVIYFLVIYTVKELASPVTIPLNFFRIWRISMFFFKKTLMLIPKIFLAWVTFLVVIYLLLFLVIKLHFICFNTWEIILPKFAGGTIIDSKIVYKALTFNKFLQHISFLKVYFFFFYDILCILFSAVWGVIKIFSACCNTTFILNILLLPPLFFKFVICDTYTTLSETFLLVTSILSILGKIIILFINWLYKDSSDWVILAILDSILLMSFFSCFCYFIYSLHDHDYYKDKTNAVFIVAVLRNIFFFLVFVLLLVVCKNICVHIDKFLLVNYDYKWRVTSVSIYKTSLQFFIAYYTINSDYVQFASSLDQTSFIAFTDKLISLNIHKYILMGSSFTVILIAWIVHLRLAFMGSCLLDSLDAQCTETKRLMKLEEQNSNKINFSFYVLIFGFISIISLNALGPDIFTKIVLNSFLFPLFTMFIEIICTVLIGFTLIFTFMQIYAPNFFYYFYLFLCLSVILHFIVELYIKYNIFTKWQVSQNFGVRDTSMSEYDQLNIVDLLTLFYYITLAFIEYVNYEPDTTFFNFIITKVH